MALLTFRAEIEALLADWLGTYTLANSATTPALSVRAPGDPRPAGTTVAGLEVIIQRDPVLTPVPAYRDRPMLGAWVCWLVAWSDPESADGAAQLIAANYPTEIQPVDVLDGSGPQHQLRLLVRDVAALPEPSIAQLLLLETGDNLLAEDDGNLIQEYAA